jgi:hypothetical protein
LCGAGTVSTADGEARDITSFASGSAARDRANKDVARRESLFQVAGKAATTKLSMAGGEGLDCVRAGLVGRGA